MGRGSYEFEQSQYGLAFLALQMRIGILVSHPIQYYSPLFGELAKSVDLEVYYASRGSAQSQANAGFEVPFEWDVDLLSGYSHTFLTNTSRRPTTNAFRGCDTPELKQIIRRRNFDAFIVFGWYLKSHWQAIRGCRRANIPILVRGDSQLLGHRSALKSLAKLVTHRLALRQFDGFLSVGQRNRQYLLRYGVPQNRIFFSPHFVNNVWFAERAKVFKARRMEIRAGWGAISSTFVVMFAGKFLSNKRPLDLIKALDLLIIEGMEVMAIFVGSGKLESEMRRLAAQLNVRAVFAGFQNQTDMPKFYSCADVLVVLSKNETWGLVVNEGMACGLPAIVSDTVGCGPDLIEEGRTGFTYPLGNVEALADRIKQVSELKASYFHFEAAIAEKLSAYSVDSAASGLIAGAGVLVNR